MQRKPAPGPVAHFTVLLAHAGDDLGQHALQVGGNTLGGLRGRFRKRDAGRGGHRNQSVTKMGDRPAHVGGQQVELLLRLRAEAAQGQVAPHQHDGESGRGLKVDQVVVEPIELVIAMAHLLVDGGQLLVGRLEFLLARLQLLVDGLELFVGGLNLLVGGLEFLVGGLVLLLQRLEVFARLGEVGFELGDARGCPRLADRRCGRNFGPPRPAGLFRFLEQNQEAALGQVLERNHFQGYGADLAVALHADVLAARGPVFLPCLVDRGAQRQHQSFAGHLQHVEGGLAGGRLEVCAGCPPELEDLEIGADQHPGRRELVDGDAVGLALRIQLAAQSVHRALSTSRARQRRRPGWCEGSFAVRLGDRQMKGRDRGRLPGEDLVLAVHRLEQIGEAPDGFGSAQQQESARAQRIVERGQRLLLQGRLQIDQQVAATHDIHAREGRVGDQVLAREDHHLAQALADAVAAFFLGEEPPQALGRNLVGEAPGVQAVAGLVEQRVVEVGGEDLELAHPRGFLGRLHERHGDGVRLLAGGAAEHPAAQRIAGALLEQFGQDRALEHVEHFGIAEETRHTDQHVRVERVDLLGVAVVAQEPGVLRQRVVLGEDHAAADPPLDGSGLVEREVHPGMVTQEQEDFLVAFRCGPGGARGPGSLPGSLAARTLAGGRGAAGRQRRVVILMRGGLGAIVFAAGIAAAIVLGESILRFSEGLEFVRLPRGIRMPGDPREFFGNAGRRENQIDAAGRHGAARHRVVFGRIILREGDSALGLDRLQAQRAVGGGAREHHTDGQFALIGGERFEEGIDGSMRHMNLLARFEFQNAPHDAQARGARNDVDAIGLDRLIVDDLGHGERSGARKNLRQRAFMLRVEVLHEHEAHAGVGRESFEQLRERFQSAGRGADADYGERRSRAVPAGFLRGRVRRVNATSGVVRHGVRLVMRPKSVAYSIRKFVAILDIFLRSLVLVRIFSH